METEEKQDTENVSPQTNETESVPNVSQSMLDLGKLELDMHRYDYIEKRVMRGVVFFIVIVAACWFLIKGIFMAGDFFINVLEAKKEVVAIFPQIPFKIEDKESFQNIKSLLSTGSMMTLIAFILGVGLTLLLTIIRAFFGESKASNDKSKNVISDIATPLSKLIEAIIHKITKSK